MKGLVDRPSDLSELGDDLVVGKGIRLQIGDLGKILGIVAQSLHVLHETHEQKTVRHVGSVAFERQMSHYLFADLALELVHLDVLGVDLSSILRSPRFAEVNVPRGGGHLASELEHSGEIFPHARKWIVRAKHGQQFPKHPCLPTVYKR
jgi:hypothetical protein